MGPPTCGLGPSESGQVCMSPTRAAGGIAADHATRRAARAGTAAARSDTLRSYVITYARISGRASASASARCARRTTSRCASWPLAAACLRRCCRRSSAARRRPRWRWRRRSPTASGCRSRSCCGSTRQPPVDVVRAGSGERSGTPATPARCSRRVQPGQPWRSPRHELAPGARHRRCTHARARRARVRARRARQRDARDRRRPARSRRRRRGHLRRRPGAPLHRRRAAGGLPVVVSAGLRRA